MRILAAALAALLLLGGCMVSKEEYVKKAVRADELEDQNALLRQKVEDAAVTRAALEEKVGELGRRIDQSERRGEGYRVAAGDAQGAMETLRNEKLTLASEVEGLKKALQAANENGATQKALLDEARASLEQSGARCAETTGRLDGQIEKLRARVSNLEAERDVLTEQKHKTSSEKEEKLQEVSRSYETVIGNVREEGEKGCLDRLAAQKDELDRETLLLLDRAEARNLECAAKLELLTVQTPFKIQDEVLFAPGAVALKSEGKTLLAAVGKALAGETGRVILVEAHGDRAPGAGVKGDKAPPPWEFTSARAAAVARFLGEKAGLAGFSLVAAGFGDTQPVAANDTREGRAKNRRIEIKVLAKEALRSGPGP